MTVTSFFWRHRRVTTAFGVAAALFNPVVPVHMNRNIWELFDLLAFWVFLIGPCYLWPKNVSGVWIDDPP